MRGYFEWYQIGLDLQKKYARFINLEVVMLKREKLVAEIFTGANQT